jgi:hypothetical protein
VEGPQRVQNEVLDVFDRLKTALTDRYAIEREGFGQQVADAAKDAVAKKVDAVVETLGGMS